MKLQPKRLVLETIYGRWRRPCPFVEGYTVFLPSPTDMPFLLRYALEALSRMDLAHCRGILVIPDSFGADGGAALRQTIAEAGGGLPVPIELVAMRPVDRLVLRASGRNGAVTHWMQAITGTTYAQTAHAFLHDSDAFFLDRGALEAHYAACRDRGMSTLGVDARRDEAFLRKGYTIPGTWELMFSTRWARSRPPIALRGGWRETSDGPILFDSMLYPQYLDHPLGTIGVLDPAPRIVHFSGTICTYREFRARQAVGGSGVDEFFRILLLAILEDLMPAADGSRVVPTVAELARGLDEPRAPITYGSETARQQYPIFRSLIDDLCDGETFRGARADQIRDRLRPFDDHFAARPAASPGEFRVRINGLG